MSIAAAQAPSFTAPRTPQAVPGEYIVKRGPAGSPNLAAAVRALGGDIVDALPSIDAVVVRMRGPGALSLGALDRELRAMARVAYVEPNWRVHALDTLPDDPDFPRQWGLPQIKAPTAWDTRREAPGVVVAVIDTGIDYTHYDLRPNMWTNDAEENGTPGTDDDNNGITDDIYGANFETGSGTGDPFDDHYHGTHVAGIAAALTDNAMGVAGTAWKAELMAVKFLDASGSGSAAGAIKAIDYAVQMKVQVMNASWGGYGFSQGIYDAIEVANREGILFVAAAGNEGVDNDGAMPMYPASYDLPNILAVQWTERDDSKSSYGNFGKTAVDLAAPGSEIHSTMPNNGADELSGSSMATPFVSGAAALVAAANSGWKADRIKERLMNTVDKIPALDGMNATGGRLNLAKALEGAGGACPADPSLIAYGEFFDEAKKSFSAHSNVLEVSFTLPKPMVVHITAHASARRTAGTGASTFTTGLLANNADPTIMWKGSLRRGTFQHDEASQNVSSSFTISMPAGAHTAYWKLWLSNFTMTFAAANLTVQAIPCAMGGTIPAAGMNAFTTRRSEQEVSGPTSN
jgi:subtilisin family serine protease